LSRISSVVPLSDSATGILVGFTSLMAVLTEFAIIFFSAIS
jgi:hypothetical protein